ncbi:MAG: hypothetical protein M1812_003108 [Candelaria pacifica]|nr:MAG: hypothetical protein M1812_003108 [Candelaria pacifica]
MRILLGIITFTIFGYTKAASSTGLVYTFDLKSPHSVRDPQTTSPGTARLILAQRLGLSQYHSLNGVDDLTLQQLNAFGGERACLFGDDEGATAPAKLLVLVDGVQEPDDILPSRSFSPSFGISSPPSSSANEQLLVDLRQQTSSKLRREGHYCAYSIGKPGLSGALDGVRPSSGTCPSNNDFIAKMSPGEHGHLENLVDFKHTMASGIRTYGGDRSSAIIYIDTLTAIAKKYGPSGEDYKKAVSILQDAFRDLASFAANGEQESTVILMPTSTNNAKRSANPYGTYDISARSAIARQGKYEAPLSAATDPEASAAPKSGPRPSHPQVMTPAAFKSTVSVCHTNFNSCVAATNNCTGRGHCERKYSSDNGKEARVDCFACSCHKTIKVDEDGKVKTTYWGGAACTKKDVSMPFFLLAGFTISFVLVISFGVGLLYSIGAEELPSVIGAGVASQRAK